MEFVSECGNCPFGISIYGNVSFIHFLYGTIQLCGMAFLTGFLRLKKLSYDNNSQDIAYPLLPIYNIVIIYCIIIGILVGVESLIDIDQNLIYVKSSLFFAFHSCSEGVAVLLLYRSLGFRAIRNSFLFGISWGFVATAIPTLIYVFTSSFFDYAVSVLCAYVLTTVFYLSLYLLPISFLFRRPALIIYARWFSAMNGILTILFLLDTLQCDTISCYAEMITAIVEFLNPFIVLYALKQDSLYWQGLYTSSDVATLNQPLLGIWRLGDDTISCITETINRLEKKVVPIIPFTQLQLDTSEYFPGGSARVYRGMCQGKEVAIKILFCMELTPESVIAFCEEASLLYSLHHANIVTCYGVSIMPPAVSIVTEFCHFGSLFDFLYNTDIMSDFDFESVAGRSSAQASQMTRGARLAQISENSHSSQISQRSKSNDTLGQKRTQSRANSRKKPSREGDDDASESLLIEYKPSFSIFNYFSWLGKPYQAKHIVTNDRERTNSNSNHQFYDANTGNLDAITQQVYAPQPSQVTSRNNRKSRDDGSASVASFDTVNQSSKASSHEQSQSNNELGLNTATNSTYLLASDTRIRADTSNSLGSIGRVASGRISSGRVSSFNSAESSQLSMSNSLGILHNVTDNSFSPGSSFQLYGTRAESNSYQDTSALAFFVGSSTDGSLEQQRRQAESFSYPIDSNSKSGGLEHMSSVSGYDAYNKEEDGNEDVNVKVTDASMSLNSQKGSIDSYSDHSTATSDFMTTILRANSMQSSLGGSEVGDLLAIDTAATAVSAFDNSASQIPSPDMSNNNSSPVLSTSPVPSPGVQDGNYTEDTNHRIPVSNVLVPAAVVTNKQKKLQVTPPPPRYEARLVLSSSNGANLTRKKTLFLQRITSGSFSRIHSSSGSTGNNGSGSGLMKSNECSVR